jgi:hypothetical protein
MLNTDRRDAEHNLMAGSLSLLRIPYGHVRSVKFSQIEPAGYILGWLALCVWFSVVWMFPKKMCKKFRRDYTRNGWSRYGKFDKTSDLPYAHIH